MGKRTKPGKPLVIHDMPLKGGVRKPRDPEQPGLPFDPVPDLVAPCLAVLKQKVPTGLEWLYEIKFDGYRVSVYKLGKHVHVRTKNGHDWTHKFPDIVAAAEGLPVESIIIDGEACVLDTMGRTDFNALQKALGPGNSGAPAADVVLYAFDVLYFDGHDLRNLDLEERRSILEGIIPEQSSAILFSEEIEADPVTLMDHVCGLNLEGIIAKHRQRPYRSGKSGDWLKIKCIQSETFAVIGFYPAAGNSVSRLLLGARKGGKWVYVGSVGSGIPERIGRPLRQALDRLTRKTPITGTRRKARFTRPDVLVEVKFRGWTSQGKLRQSSFKAVRQPGDDSEVFEIDADNGTK
jgi:bifunctional non-homologous end joining protein LigD